MSDSEIEDTTYHTDDEWLYHQWELAREAEKAFELDARTHRKLYIELCILFKNLEKENSRLTRDLTIANEYGSTRKGGP